MATRSRDADLLPFVFAAGLSQVALGITFFLTRTGLSPSLYTDLVLRNFHLFAPLTVGSGVALLAQMRGMHKAAGRTLARLLAAIPFVVMAANFVATGVPSDVLIYGLLVAGLIYAAWGGQPGLRAGIDLYRFVLTAFLVSLGMLQLAVPGSFPASAYPVPHAVGLTLFAAGILLSGLLQAISLLRPSLFPVPLAQAVAAVALAALALNFAAVQVWTGVAVYASLAVAPVICQLNRSLEKGNGSEPAESAWPVEYYYLELVTWFLVVFLTSIPLFTAEATSPTWRYLAGVTGLLSGFNVIWPQLSPGDPWRRAFVHQAFLSVCLGVLMITGDELKALLYLALSLIPIPLGGLILGPPGVLLTAGISLAFSFAEVARDSGWATTLRWPMVAWHLASHGVTTAAMAAVAYLLSLRLAEYVHERNMVLGDLRETNRVLHDMATRDSLTGLYNHGFFQERLEQELNRASRTGAPLTLAMLDLDRFKQVNDTFGHQVGDDVLRLLANILRQNLRVSDVAARYGGEEIAVIFPDTDAEGATAVIERIRQLLESAAVDVGPGQKLTGITLSAGVAHYPEAGPDRHALIRAADDALYRAKAQGRNRVCVAGPASADGALAAPGK